MRLVRPMTLLVLLLLAALAPQAAAQRTGDAITKLEAERAESPRSVAALRALGVAYYKAERHSEARSVRTHFTEEICGAPAFRRIKEGNEHWNERGGVMRYGPQ